VAVVQFQSIDDEEPSQAGRCRGDQRPARHMARHRITGGEAARAGQQQHRGRDAHDLGNGTQARALDGALLLQNIAARVARRCTAPIATIEKTHLRP
jgi:hypothetical protein